jgi:hypothetical protein
MTQLHAVAVRLGAIGRCALVGVLVGMLATQAVAEGAATVSQQTPAKPETTIVPNELQTDQINFAAMANLPLLAQDNSNQDNFDAAINALPDAPTAPAGTSESSSLTMPPELKAMMDDAKQNSQNLQSAPAGKSHGLQRPGMLIMGIVGIPLALLGGALLAADGKKDVGLRVGVSLGLLVPGAAMTGFGFYYAFKPQKQ